MNKHWQIVDKNGDIINDDDTSSIGSDWSFMQYTSDDGFPSRTHSMDRGPEPSSCPPSPSALRRRASLATLSDDLENSITQQPDPVDTVPTFPDDPNSAALNRPPHRPGSIRTRTTSSILRESNQLRQPTGFNPAESRHVAQRWNMARNKGHRPGSGVDRQLNKPLLRGPLHNASYQRQQIRMGHGAQMPQSRRRPTNKV